MPQIENLQQEIIKAKNRTPNKYKLTPKNIKTLKVLNWTKLKELTWFNNAMNKPCWCHLEGCNKPNQKYDNYSEFWLGFYEDGKVDCRASTWNGMGTYTFYDFYDSVGIENLYDLQMQINAIRYINHLIDNGILTKPVITK